MKSKISFTKQHWEQQHDESPLMAFWKGYVHLGIFVIYGGIALILMNKPGYYYLGETLAWMTGIINGIWIVFRGVPKVCRWIVSMVEV